VPRVCRPAPLGVETHALGANPHAWGLQTCSRFADPCAYGQ